MLDSPSCRWTLRHRPSCMLWLNEPVAHLTSPDRLLLVLETGAVEGFIRGVTNDGSHVEAVIERLDPEE
jgi:hypothetical protein